MRLSKPERYNRLMAKGYMDWIYIALMVACVVAVDLLFFRHRFRERLIANVAIVLVFVVVYFMLLRRK